MSDNGHEPPDGFTDSQLIRMVYRVVRNLQQFIEGPNNDRSRGLVVRVDRLERTVKLILWVAGVTVVAAIGVATSQLVR